MCNVGSTRDVGEHLSNILLSTIYIYGSYSQSEHTVHQNCRWTLHELAPMLPLPKSPAKTRAISKCINWERLEHDMKLMHRKQLKMQRGNYRYQEPSERNNRKQQQ